MFEIPDDDDLFSQISEENFGDILAEASNYTSQPKQDVTVISDMPYPSGHSKMSAPMPSANDSLDHSMGSPQTKKMRVLSDMNCPPNIAAGVQKSTVGQQASNLRTLDVSSNAPTKHDTHVETAEPNATALPRRQRLRKFPGPAGILPPAKPSELSSIMGKSPGSSPECLSEDTGSKPGDEVCSSQSGAEVFGGAAWLSLVTDLQPGAHSVLTKFSVRAMLHKASRRLLPKGKVPLMLGVLDSIDFQGTDASVVLRDPTGQMQGTLHREVLKDFGLDLQTGAAIILRQVSVISPSPRTHYLNITAGNIVAIYPTDGNRILTVPPSSSPEQAADVHPSKESVKDFVHAAEMELLEAANAAKEAAVSRLRPNRTSAHQSLPASPYVGTPANGPNTGSRLFTDTPFRGPRAGASSPFTPHRPRLAPSPTALAGGRFAFTKTSAAPQMRTPIPEGRTGGNSAARISNINSSHTQNSGVLNAGFSQKQGFPSTAFQSSSVVTRPSAPPYFSGGGHRDSRTNQQGSCRLQPPTPCTAYTVSDSVQTCLQNSVQTPVHTVTVSVSNASSHTSTLSHFTAPSTLSESDRISSSRLIDMPPPTTCPSSLQTAALSQQSSQQSKWSFKRKLCGAPVQSDSNTNNRGNSERKPVMHEQQMKNMPSGFSDRQVKNSSGGETGVSVRLGVCGAGNTASVTSNSRSAGCGTPSASVASSSLWVDDLDDDILSQLSDDF